MNERRVFGFSAERRLCLARGLKAARLRAGLTSEQASAELERCGLQCRRGTLLAWERGTGTTSREPYASDLTVFSTIYKCSIGDLFVETDGPSETNGHSQTNGPTATPTDGRMFAPPNALTGNQPDNPTGLSPK